MDNSIPRKASDGGQTDYLIARDFRRVGILVVHGVGEQTCFEHLEEIASNLCSALSRGPQRRSRVTHPDSADYQQAQVFIQIRRGHDVPYRAKIGTSWQEPAASVRWWSFSEKEWVEALFREIHWADLQMPLTVWNWMKMASWALSIYGVRLFETSKFMRAGHQALRLPTRVPRSQRTIVRMKLFLTSLFFLLIVATFGVLFFLLSRFSFQAAWIQRAYSLIFNYLGDVKLYQDYFERTDAALEVIGEKSRVAIRRRMVRALIDMAGAYERGELDGYFILAHSLGTVVAFNSLMDAENLLPNYLTQEEWTSPQLQPFKTAVNQDQWCNQPQEPKRPPWLGRGDGLSRATLFRGLQGVLTMGSPLNKFAALWPAIVTINNQSLRPPGQEIPWINVVNPQDIVAGKLALFRFCGAAPAPTTRTVHVAGLALTDLIWAGTTWWPFNAHTSYWKSRKDTSCLINRFIAWLEGGSPPRDPMSQKRHIVLSRFLGLCWIVVTSGLLLGLAAELLALGITVCSADNSTSGSMSSVSTIWNDAQPLVPAIIGWLVVGAVAVVLLFGVTRWLWEELYLTRWKNWGVT